MNTPTIHAIGPGAVISFPCWLWSLGSQSAGYHIGWMRFPAGSVLDDIQMRYSHWSPDAPEAPKVRPYVLSAYPGHDKDCELFGGFHWCKCKERATVASPQKPGLKEAVGAILSEDVKPEAVERAKNHVASIYGEAGSMGERMTHCYTEVARLLYGVLPAQRDRNEATISHWVATADEERERAEKAEAALTPFLTPATTPIQPIHANSDDTNGASFLKARIATLEEELAVAKADRTREADLCDSMAKERVPVDDEEVRQFVLMALSRHTLLNSDERQDCADQILTAFAPTYAKLEEAKLAALTAYSPPATGEGEWTSVNDVKPSGNFWWSDGRMVSQGVCCSAFGKWHDNVGWPFMKTLDGNRLFSERVLWWQPRIEPTLPGTKSLAPLTPTPKQGETPIEGTVLAEMRKKYTWAHTTHIVGTGEVQLALDTIDALRRELTEALTTSRANRALRCGDGNNFPPPWRDQPTMNPTPPTRREFVIAQAQALELQAGRIRDALTPEAEREGVYLAHVHLENIRKALVPLNPEAAHDH